MSSQENSDASRRIGHFIAKIPFAAQLKISVAQASRGAVSLRLTPEKHFMNHFSTYQAGVLFTLAEITGGALCGTFLDLSQYLLITTKAEIDFHRSSSDLILSESALDETAVTKILSSLEDARKFRLPISIHIKTETTGMPLAECRCIYYIRHGMPRRLLRNARKTILPDSTTGHDL